jgi:hypothetical protein
MDIKEINRQLEPFRNLALTSKDAEHFIKRARKINGVNSEVSKHFRIKYSIGNVGIIEAVKKFIHETKCIEQETA